MWSSTYVVSHAGGNPVDALTAFRALVDPALPAQNDGRWVVSEIVVRQLPPRSRSSDQSLAWKPLAEASPRAFLSARLDPLSVETERVVTTACATPS
jgi:two-component system sensor kinase